MSLNTEQARSVVERLRKSYRSLAGLVVVSPRLLAEAAKLIEAEIPNEDDWAWGTWNTHGNFFTPAPTESLAREMVELRPGLRLLARRSVNGTIQILAEPQEDASHG